jgi:hypothetical protein
MVIVGLGWGGARDVALIPFSGIGKGVIASSTGLLLKTAGLKVTAIKIDPYMNIDAGTMAPTEHGEQAPHIAAYSPEVSSAGHVELPFANGS